MISFARIISRLGNVAIGVGVIAFVLQFNIPVVSSHMLLIAILTIGATTVELVFQDKKTEQRA